MFTNPEAGKKADQRLGLPFRPFGKACENLIYILNLKPFINNTPNIIIFYI